MIGSAVPFESDNITFLITATHVCLKQQKRTTPLFTLCDDKAIPLNGLRLAWEYDARETPDIDITLILLSNSDANLLRTYYIFSDDRILAEACERTPGVHYIITGYPSVRNKINSLTHPLPSMATHLITGNIQHVSSLSLTDKSDHHHFAICIKEDDVPTLDGARFRIPKPQGMSGGGIWRVNIDTQSLLTTRPLLVGIGIEYHKFKKHLLHRGFKTLFH